MQEYGQPPADLVGEMVSYIYPVTHIEVEFFCNLPPSKKCFLPYWDNKGLYSFGCVQSQASEYQLIQALHTVSVLLIRRYLVKFTPWSNSSYCLQLSDWPSQQIVVRICWFIQTRLVSLVQQGVILGPQARQDPETSKRLTHTYVTK